MSSITGRKVLYYVETVFEHCPQIVNNMSYTVSEEGRYYLILSYSSSQSGTLEGELSLKVNHVLHGVPVVLLICLFEHAQCHCQ